MVAIHTGVADQMYRCVLPHRCSDIRSNERKVGALGVVRTVGGFEQQHRPSNQNPMVWTPSTSAAVTCAALTISTPSTR